MPSAVTVPTGTTLTFRMHPASYDVHTATTGPGNPETEPSSYLGQIAASFKRAGRSTRGRLPERAARPTAATLTPALHGNGFWNSGVLDTASGYAAGRRATP